MASIAIPLVEILGPTIIDLIVGLVHKKAPEVEAQYGGGTGPAKFQAVYEHVMDMLTKAAIAGQIDKTLPNDETIKLIVQCVISLLNIQGTLGTPQVPPVAGALTTTPITLPAGRQIVITIQ